MQQSRDQPVDWRSKRLLHSYRRHRKTWYWKTAGREGKDQVMTLETYIRHCCEVQFNIIITLRACFSLWLLSGDFVLCISGWSVMFWARVTEVDTSTKYILTGGAQTIASHGVAIGVHGSALMVRKWNPASSVRMVYNMAKYNDFGMNTS